MNNFDNYTDEAFNGLYQSIKDYIKPIVTNERFLNYSSEAALGLMNDKLFNHPNAFLLGTITKTLQGITLEYITRRLKQYAITQYIYLKKISDFGLFGEQRISISFCRNLLTIPNDRDVTDFDRERFNRIVDEHKEKIGLKNPIEYFTYLKEYEIDFYGVQLSVDETLNKYLEKFCVEYEISIEHDKDMISFIFGKIENDKYSNDIGVIEYEIIRSPLSVLSNVTFNNYIRIEALEVIYNNKWKKFFNQSKIEQKKALQHPNSSIRENIKKCVLLLHGATEDTIDQQKEEILCDMIDDCFYFKIGGQVKKKDINSYLSSLEPFFRIYDNVLDGISTALLDWIPGMGNKTPLLKQLLEISYKNNNKAQRFLFKHISDYWYVDEEEYMKNRSFILISLMLYYIKREILFDFAAYKNDGDILYTFLVNEFHKILLTISNFLKQQLFKSNIPEKLCMNNYKTLVLDKIKNENDRKIIERYYNEKNSENEYTLRKHLDKKDRKELFRIFNSLEYQDTLDYEQMEFALYRKKNHTLNTLSLKKLVTYTSFWNHLMDNLNESQTEVFLKLEEVLHSEEIRFNKSLVTFLSHGKPEKYNFSLENYVYTRCEEVGLLKKPRVIDYSVITLSLSSKVKFIKNNQVGINEKLEEIYNGVNYEISINYQGKKDPFILFVQEVMLKSKLGSITSPMSLGVFFDPGDSSTVKMQYIKEELEGIRDLIESEMYENVALLKIHKEYNVKNIVMDLLDGITFFTGSTLKSKIQKIEEDNIKDKSLFNVYIPLKKGYMDWNTSQAVWRINQDIRPKEFSMFWTIDKNFLDVLFEEYLEVIEHEENGEKIIREQVKKSKKENKVADGNIININGDVNQLNIVHDNAIQNNEQFNYSYDCLQTASERSLSKLDSDRIVNLSNEVKNFIVERFGGSEAEFDSFCRELGIKSSIFTGNFDVQVTSLIKHLEMHYPDTSERLFNVLIKLRPSFEITIRELFNKEEN